MHTFSFEEAGTSKPTNVHIITTDGFTSIGELCEYLDKNAHIIPNLSDTKVIQSLMVFAYELGRHHVEQETK